MNPQCQRWLNLSQMAQGSCHFPRGCLSSHGWGWGGDKSSSETPTSGVYLVTMEVACGPACMIPPIREGFGGPLHVFWANVTPGTHLLSPQANGKENTQWGYFRPWPCHAARLFISLSLAAPPRFFPEGEVRSPLLPGSSLSRVSHSLGLSSPRPPPGPSMQPLPPQGGLFKLGGGSSHSLTRLPSQFPLQSRLLLTNVRKGPQFPSVPSVTSFPWAGSTGAWLQGRERVGKEGNAVGKEYQLVF